jgi:hypothetical protein
MPTPPKPDEPDETRIEPFAAVLQKIQNGRTHDELSVGMRDLVAAVIETGKAGTLTFTIKVAPSKAEGIVELSDKVDFKPPKFERPASIFFVDDEHNLSRSDPRQQEIPGVRGLPSNSDREDH